QPHMKLKYTFKQLVACIVCLATTSCSLLSSGTQKVRIETNKPDCVIKADGVVVGRGEMVVARLKKNKSHVITAQNGNQKGMAVLDSELSLTGKLDFVGGLFYLIPFIGFVSAGAWELDREVVIIDVE
ncbi:MAG: hypothetical protein II295_07015, partial [Akkermansia sp.]|nr:hypothetical protein [Akkermansia sp.]